MLQVLLKIILITSNWPLGAEDMDYEELHSSNKLNQQYLFFSICSTFQRFQFMVGQRHRILLLCLLV